MTVPVPEEIAISRNPVIVSDGYDQVQFKVPAGAEIYIFTLSGKLVKRLAKAGALIRTWDLKNQNGKQIASGVYLWLVKGEGFEQLNKFTVIR